MKFCQPILEDIIRLPDNWTHNVPKSPFECVCILPDISINFSSGLIDNFWAPTCIWEYRYITENSIIKNGVRTYEKPNDGAMKKNDYYKLRHKYEYKLNFKPHSIIDYKKYYADFQDNILSKRDKQEFIYAQNILLTNIRQMQRKYTTIVYGPLECVHYPHMNAYLLSNNNQMIRLKRKS